MTLITFTNEQLTSQSLSQFSNVWINIDHIVTIGPNIPEQIRVQSNEGPITKYQSEENFIQTRITLSTGEIISLNLSPAMTLALIDTMTRKD